MSTASLHGQVALVTGAGRRIGRAVAMRLAAEGARVIVHYRNSEAEANAVVAEITKAGGEAIAIYTDLAKVAEIGNLFDEVGRRFSRLDILINNAAVFAPTPLQNATEAQWDDVFDSNVKASFFCCQKAAPLLTASGHGRIVNFASLGGLLAWPKYTAYSVSKAGVIQLTRTLARALAPAVTVNAIAPGTISFPEDAPEIAADFIARTPLKSTGAATDIADAVLYLVGAAFVTGQILVVDGGRSIPT